MKNIFVYVKYLLLQDRDGGPVPGYHPSSPQIPEALTCLGFETREESLAADKTIQAISLISLLALAPIMAPLRIPISSPMESGNVEYLHLLGFYFNRTSSPSILARRVRW